MAYLLHDNNGRYAQDAILVREGTIVHKDVLEIKTLSNGIKINATECFPGNILAPAEHAKKWLRREASHVTVGDSIMKAIANTYGPIFM